MKAYGSFVLAALFGFACLGASSTVLAANASKEIATAAQHAQFSAASSKIKNVHMHMHHVLNCLVGPDGDGFDGSFANPCQSMGNGAIEDAPGKVAESLDTVADLIRTGLEVDQLEPAQDIARAAHGLLEHDSKM